MRQYFLERDASARVAYKKSKAPTYNINRVKLTEGTPEVLEVKKIDGRPAGDFPIENPFDVLMLELESQFRYNNARAVGKIRNFTAVLGKSTSQRHNRVVVGDAICEGVHAQVTGADPASTSSAKP